MNLILPGKGVARQLYQRIRQQEQDLRKQVRQRLHNPSGETNPTFLVGCGRSGTSMLVFRLGGSWQVDLFNEDHPAAFLNYRLRPLAEIGRLVGRSHAPVTLFKPILDTHRSVELLEHFPTARLLFCFRHVDDVVNSSLKRFGRENRLNHVRGWMEDDFAELPGPPPPASTKEAVRALWQPDLDPDSGAALFWLFYNRLYFDLELDREPRVTLVRYETLVAEPEQEFRRLCAFLGLHYEPAMAHDVFASSVGRGESPAIEPAIRAACDALWARLGERLEA